MKKNNDENMYKTISSYILGDKGIPHCIIELSVKELRDLNSNRIHVSGIRSENNKIYYSTIGEYGKNINHSNVTRLIDEVNVNLHRINITKSKKTLVIKSTSRYNCPQGKEGINDTGVVVLFFGVVPPPTKIKYKMEMNKSFAETIAKTKNNITKKVLQIITIAQGSIIHSVARVHSKLLITLQLANAPIKILPLESIRNH